MATTLGDCDEISTAKRRQHSTTTLQLGRLPSILNEILSIYMQKAWTLAFSQNFQQP